MPSPPSDIASGQAGLSDKRSRLVATLVRILGSETPTTLPLGSLDLALRTREWIETHKSVYKEQYREVD